ncbi:hypothetical protein BAE44_0008639, partial [Dichanthelium oligosanthes]
LVCNVTVHYTVRRLGGGGLAEAAVCAKPARTRASESEQHLTDDPSGFLDYDQTRRMACRLFTRLPGLHGLDLSPSNWYVFTPDVIATNILRTVHDNENKGLCGGHYRFTVSMDIEVRLVFSEPKALIRYCSEEVRQTLDPATSNPCGVCLDDLMSSSRTLPVRPSPPLCKRLRGLDLSTSNWDILRPDTIATSFLQIVQANHDRGLCGGHYRFAVDMDATVTLVFSEPEALLRYCGEEVTQVVVNPAIGDRCGICSDDAV